MGLKTSQLLAAGCATFTLSGRDRRWTYRINKVDGRNGGPPMFFVNLLVGPDNGRDYQYLGVYERDNGLVRLTRKSRLSESSEPVRAIRWFVALVAADKENEVTNAGFAVHWSDECQRCGAALTVPSSIDARLGPICAKAVASGM